MTEPLTDTQKNALSAAMRDAVYRQDVATIRECVARGGDVDRPVAGKDFNCAVPLMHHVVMNFNETVAFTVFKNTGNIDVREPTCGETALLVAARHVKEDAIAFLAVRGADPLALNKAGNDTPLDNLRRAIEVCQPAVKTRLMAAMLPPPGSMIVKKSAAPAAAELVTGEDVRTIRPIEFKPLKKSGNDKQRLKF